MLKHRPTGLAVFAPAQPETCWRSLLAGRPVCSWCSRAGHVWSRMPDTLRSIVSKGPSAGLPEYLPCIEPCRRPASFKAPMAAAKEGCCKEYYERGTCRYGGSCRYAHIGEHVAGDITCRHCQKSAKDMCLTDCKHLACLGCAISKFSQDGRCPECGEYTHGRFHSI